MPEFFPGVYHAGARAYLDAFISGIIPCTVVRVIEPGPGNRYCVGKIEIKIGEERGGYRKGEVVVRSSSMVFPRDRLFTRGCYYRINTQYEWQ